MKQQTVTINGTVYDSQTGEVIRVERNNDKSVSQSAHAVHVQQQRSKTLNRRYVRRNDTKTHGEKKPTHAVTAAHVDHPRTKANHAISVHRSPTASRAERSETISRFAEPTRAEDHHTHTQRHSPDTPALAHPITQTVHQQLAAKQPVERVVKPSHIIKREAIEHATAKMPAKHTRKATHHKQQRSKFGRLASVGSASLAVLVLGAYLTYLNMPTLSTRIAASQAGIDASYPSYSPMGYSLSGPVAYKEGTVTMKFAANAGPQNYTLTQTKSGWDSSAVLEYYVEPHAGGNYITTTINGLTIYTYGDNVVWVNGGILYTIDGNATLSDSQIQRIATSL
ncbi:MAG: hypothetical protein WBP12_02230 [Candidatus Saccharimonas sp.]